MCVCLSFANFQMFLWSTNQRFPCVCFDEFRVDDGVYVSVHKPYGHTGHSGYTVDNTLTYGHLSDTQTDTLPKYMYRVYMYTFRKSDLFWVMEVFHDGPMDIYPQGPHIQPCNYNVHTSKFWSRCESVLFAGVEFVLVIVVFSSRVSGNDMKYVASTLTLTLDTGD